MAWWRPCVAIHAVLTHGFLVAERRVGGPGSCSVRSVRSGVTSDAEEGTKMRQRPKTPFPQRYDSNVTSFMVEGASSPTMSSTARPPAPPALASCLCPWL